MSESTNDAGAFTLHLLDSATGNPVKTWSFEDQEKITMGRSSDVDISISDTQVSRLHLEIVLRDDKWWLVSHGRNGTSVEGVLATEERLYEGTIFQLGVSGPTFKFEMVHSKPATVATMDNIDPNALDFLDIDVELKTEEIKKITEDENFKRLEEEAKRLKQNK